MVQAMHVSVAAVAVIIVVQEILQKAQCALEHCV
jgi:hypothetical protein